MRWFKCDVSKVSEEDLAIGWENLRKKEKDLAFREECFERRKELFHKENELKIIKEQLTTQTEVAKMKAAMEYDAYHWYHKECDKMMNDYRAMVDKFISLLPQLKGEIQMLECGCCDNETPEK